LIRNTLRGFATIRLGRSLVVHDCPAPLSHGRKWVALPAKPQLTCERELLMRDGKILYVPVLEWGSRDAQYAFSEAVVAAIEAEYPEAFDLAEATV
jgi:hypothetical protein